jgi:hypothetical protein
MDPRDENQKQRDTVIMVAFPEMGKWSKEKLKPGRLAGRVQRVGKR